MEGRSSTVMAPDLRSQWRCAECRAAALHALFDVAALCAAAKDCAWVVD